jgi:hypothetical protein
MEKQTFTESDKLTAEVLKLEAETVYLLNRSKTEIPRLFFYGVSTAIGIVAGLAAIAKLMSGV